jgi:uncharacterized repeat protein (TIGR01451 family)
MRLWLLLALLIAPVLLPAVDAEVRAGSITMSPPNPSTNTPVTICFDIRNTGAQTIRFAVGYAPAGYVYNCNTVNQINWVLSDYGAYRGTNLTISGTASTVTSNNYTDVQGPSSGINGGTTSGSNWKQVCFDTHIPPEFSGDYQLVIVPNRDGIGLSSRSCGSCQQASNAASFGYLGFTVTGTPLYKLDLEVCNAGSTASEMRWRYRVTNYGESGVRLTNISMRYCFYDTNTCLEAQGSSNAQAYLPGGGSYCNTYNPADQYSFEQFSMVDCGQDGRANQCYNYTIAGGPISQSMPYYIPPAGGNIRAQDPPIWFRFCGSPTWDTSDDYSNLTLAPSCGSGWSSLPRVALYNEGALVCEWESAADTDPASGVPHCGSVSGCNNCPPGSIPNLARNATGPSNVVCLPILSPTPTPGLQLTKTADRATATIGETVTFSIAWVNDSSSTLAMVIWDTVPSHTTYVGCATPVGSCGISGSVVSWDLGNRPAGSSGTVTFWAVVSSYPFAPGWLDQRLALGPPAPRSRELQLGLWDPLNLP